MIKTKWKKTTKKQLKTKQKNLVTVHNTRFCVQYWWLWVVENLEVPLWLLLLSQFIRPYQDLTELTWILVLYLLFSKKKTRELSMKSQKCPTSAHRKSNGEKHVVHDAERSGIVDFIFFNPNKVSVSFYNPQTLLLQSSQFTQTLWSPCCSLKTLDHPIHFGCHVEIDWNDVTVHSHVVTFMFYHFALFYCRTLYSIHMKFPVYRHSQATESQKQCHDQVWE